MTEFIDKKTISDFSKDEFGAFIRHVTNFEGRTEKEDSAILMQFNAICPHPSKSDLIYWPAEGADDSPEGVVAEIERYCRENGLPGFKDSDF
jgi:hypothetical protein